jgi:hypothetical protein
MRLRLVAAAVATAALVSFSRAPEACAQTAGGGASMAQQRADAALKTFTLLVLQYSAGTATAEEVGAWGERWYRARRDTGLSGQALAGAAQEWVDKMRSFERVVAARVNTGTAPASDAQKAAYFRLDAEIELSRVRHP